MIVVACFNIIWGVSHKTVECDITTRTIRRSAPICFGCYEGENHSLIDNDTLNFVNHQLSYTDVTTTVQVIPTI